ncbi:MAG: hypothetical protein WCA44_06060, partial [Acidobacteriaceae bacterium]
RSTLSRLSSLPACTRCSEPFTFSAISGMAIPLCLAEYARGSGEISLDRDRSSYWQIACSCLR